MYRSAFAACRLAGHDAHNANRTSSALCSAQSLCIRTAASNHGSAPVSGSCAEPAVMTFSPVVSSVPSRASDAAALGPADRCVAAVPGFENFVVLTLRCCCGGGGGAAAPLPSECEREGGLPHTAPMQRGALRRLRPVSKGDVQPVAFSRPSRHADYPGMGTGCNRAAICCVGVASGLRPAYS